MIALSNSLNWKNLKYLWKNDRPLSLQITQAMSATSMEPGEARQITSIACVGEHIVWYGIWWAPGMVWYGTYWFGMVWHGMAWYGMVTMLWLLWLPYYGIWWANRVVFWWTHGLVFPGIIFPLLSLTCENEIFSRGSNQHLNHTACSSILYHIHICI